MATIPFELKGKTVFVAGHGGMVGSALVRRLARENVELLTAERREVDLRDQAAVNSWFADKRPQAVFLAAAKVGPTVDFVHRFVADQLFQNEGGSLPTDAP